MAEKKPKTIKKDPKQSDLLKEDVGREMDMKTLHDSKGGKDLVKGLVSDIVGALGALSEQVDKLSHVQMIALVCKIKERADLLQVLTGAAGRLKVYENLLAEELEKEKEEGQ